ncbi:aspartate aminotransferase family protein [Ectothiorhodospiraceae bacterium BW-2]|nr:aspartate aminotransferase family protein [Ectothiorhodospiraceae bacterium BW-2]
MSHHLMNTYARQPVAFTRGEGATLWDSQGKSYLDTVAGIAVCNLGHCHPDITATIQQQATELLHTSNLFDIPAQQRLGAKLAQLAGMERVFFCNSGAEANEAAVKLARLYGHQRGIDTPTIIVMEQSFHGRTMATLTATGNRKVQAGFEPLVHGFVRVPFNDIAAIEKVAAQLSDVVAILVEPIQGEGGVQTPADTYLPELRRLCDQHQWLLMLDEIQTGIGRTGKMFAFQHSDIVPDVMSLAKGLGNGIPIGACLARGQAAELFKPGHHGTTFGGNPFSTTIAGKVLEVIERDAILEHSAAVGAWLLTHLKLALGDQPFVRDIRGKGMMLGIELDRPCGQLVAAGLERGLILNITAGSVIRLIPPLILRQEEAESLVTTLSQLIFNFINDSSQSE